MYIIWQCRVFLVEYVESDPSFITVIRADGAKAENFIVLRYHQR